MSKLPESFSKYKGSKDGIYTTSVNYAYSDITYAVEIYEKSGGRLIKYALTPKTSYIAKITNHHVTISKQLDAVIN
jgi:hypothetical protein